MGGSSPESRKHVASDVVCEQRPQPLTSLKVMLIVPSPGCSLTSFRLSRCGAELAGDILPGHDLPPCKRPFLPATWYRYPCPSITHVSGLYSRVCRYGVLGWLPQTVT